MFKRIQRKLTIQYAAFFLVFVFVLMFILYISIKAVFQQQQVQELKQFYKKEQYHLVEDKMTRNSGIEYDSNRTYFYYVFTRNHKLVHADESLYGLHRDIDRLMPQTKDGKPQIVVWKKEHLLLIKYYESSSNGNYLIVGQIITKQNHFLERMMYAFILLTIVGTLLIILLSHYLAGKAMLPIKRSFDKQRKFVSDASHELRTPLTVFYSSLEVLESDEENHFGSFGKEVMQDLKEETQHMKTLLEGLLFLARYDQNKLTTKVEQLELSNIVNSITKSFERTLPLEVRLKTKIVDNILLQGDETSIRELLYILLDNAAKFTEYGHIYVTLTSLSGKIVLTVEDTGIGISNRDLPHIFDRFYQVTKNRQKKGTGLGLAIAQAIVSQHNGEIVVESIVQKGTKFTIRFPGIKQS